ICTRLGLKEGETLPRSVVEFYFKDDKLGDPMVSEDHITAWGWASPQEIDEMMAYALRVNDYLSGLFAAAHIRLIDFKLEFGRQYENDMMRLILADEISPDGCRLWDLQSGEVMDKDRFRKDLGNVVEGYREVARRLGILRNDDAPGDSSGPVLVSST
ncbi:MAG: phosphoribosylaminoimidazolesuccinocarboxamide synthase, partial [Pseudomonadota bacterium]